MACLSGSEGPGNGGRNAIIIQCELRTLLGMVMRPVRVAEPQPGAHSQPGPGQP